jgi:hypothetical protein
MDRLAIPLLMPVAVTAVVVLIIVAIGSLLLWCTEVKGEDLATAVALALAGAVLIGCTIAAQTGPKPRSTRH